MELFFLEKEVLSTDSHIRTLLTEFDGVKGAKFFSFTHGGTIIEICGASGSGKTLLCMQLAVNVTIPKIHDGPGGEVIYIETDRKFVSSRLTDVYRGSVSHLGFDWHIDDKLHYHSTRRAEGLIQVVSELEEGILNGTFQNVRLIVIDSLSTVFRDKMSEFGEMVRAENKLMSNLAQLAMKFNLMIVVTSQITDKWLASENYCHRPDRRLILTRLRGNNNVALVDKFSAAHPRVVNFRITSGGIRN